MMDRVYGTRAIAPLMHFVCHHGYLYRASSGVSLLSLTLRGGHHGSVWLHVREAAPWLPSRSPAGQQLVHAAILRLQVLYLRDVLEAVYVAAKVGLPHCRVGLVAVFARMDSPLAKESSVGFLAEASLLGVYPRHSEDRLFRVDPFQAVEAARVHNAAEPVSHSLRPLLVVGWSRYRRQNGRFVARGTHGGKLRTLSLLVGREPRLRPKEVRHVHRAYVK